MALFIEAIKFKNMLSNIVFQPVSLFESCDFDNMLIIKPYDGVA